MMIDDAFARASSLFAEVSARIEEIETEQDARLQLINRILVEVLGWEYQDIKTEPHSPSGYTDYLLSTNGQKRLVVEAKRVGTILVDTFDPKFGSYKLSGKAISSAIEGVEQAARYCFDHGVNCAVVTTGVAWIVFIPFPGAGISFRESHAFVFPNFASILEKFAAFFDLLSKPGIISRLYTLHFARAAGLSIAEFEPLVVANRNEDARLLAPSPLASDLDPVFREFFGAMSADHNPEMLIECFVETRESRFADASLEKLVRTVTASITELDPATDNLLAREISSAVESGTGETIVIVGNAGAGKSTFMERFFASVLDPALRSKCLVIKIDLKKWTGDIASLQSWLTLQVKATMEQQLYGPNGPAFDELMGLYFSEYQRWSQGQFKPLYDSDKTAFKVKFGTFLHEQLDKNPYDYILRMLQDVVRNRKLLPCLIFDNTDTFANPKIQESVFQFSQAIRENVPFTFVIVPITDTSFWRLSKAGPFQSYASKMFYLPVPSTKAVLEKRVAYLKRKIEETPDKRSYLLTHGIKLSVDNINAFAACVEEVFLREDFAARRISWLANNNVHTALEITHRVIVSPFLSIDDLVKTYVSRGGRMYLEHRKMMHALILGNRNHFQQDDNPYVLNVFEISPHFLSSPLLYLSILKVLIDRAGEEVGIGSYMSVEQVRRYFDSAGVTEAAINFALNNLLVRRLAQPYDASSETVETSERIAITHAGRIHYDMALNDPFYLTDMAYATPVRNSELVDRLRNVREEGKMGAAEWREVQKQFATYCLNEDGAFVRLPKDEMYDGQRQLRADFRGRWIEDDTPAQVVEGESRPEARQYGYSQIPATVKWFNPMKGYGFVEAGLGEDAFLHSAILKLSEIDSVSDGDSITCDIAQGSQGRLQVIAIHSLQRNEASTVQTSAAQQQVEGVVEFYNFHKGYGFIKAETLAEDVYISARVLEQCGLKSLVQDQNVRVKIEPGRLGKGYMATFVELV